MNINSNRNISVLAGLSILILGLTLIGCAGSGGSDNAPLASNPTAATEPTAVVSGKTVDFCRVCSGLDSVGLLIRVSNVPADFSPTVTVKTTDGKEKVLAKASIPGAPLTLAYSGFDLFEAAAFQTLEFSQPLPEGAVVELVDANSPGASLEAKIRGAKVGFRKRFDINGDQWVTTSDLALVLAWIQTSRSNDESVIRARGLEIFPTMVGGVATLPATIGENLNGDTLVDSKDVVLAMAWIQCGRISDTALVASRALEISSLVTTPPTKFPGENVPGAVTNLVEIVLPGGVNMQFVALPSGKFLRGSYLVNITKPLLMGMTEVTRAQYQAVLGADPSYFRTSMEQPVDSVSWEDAVNFCNALSDHLNLSHCYTRVGTETLCDFATNGYRLPTEAEWEFACRAGTTTDFYWASFPQGSTYLPDVDLYCWYGGNSGGTTHEVAKKLPNPWGLYDMTGNVTELVNDWGNGSYAVGEQTDPTGPATGSYVMVRGGSYSHSTYQCTNAIRNGTDNNNPYNGRTGHFYYQGFRVVRNQP